MHSARHRFISWLSIILGLVLIASSMLKAINIYSFATEAGEYIDLYMFEWMHGWKMFCAISVCCIEMLIGLLSFKHEYIHITSIFMMLVLAFFVYITGINLFFPTIFGSIESCGCFGELVHFTPLASFVKSVALWVIALVLFAWCVNTEQPFRVSKIIRDWYVYASVLASLVLPLLSLCCFNQMEHESYMIIYAVLCGIVATGMWIVYKKTS